MTRRFVFASILLFLLPLSAYSQVANTGLGEEDSVFDRIPPPITDFFIPADQVSARPPTKESPGDFIGRIYAPIPEDWETRAEAQPITGVTVTIMSGPRFGESVGTDENGYYLFPNVQGDELHLLVEKEHFEPKEVIVHRSLPTKLANGAVLNYPEDPQQHPGNILIGQRWPDEVRFIFEETLVVHDLLYAEGGIQQDTGGFYSRGVIVIYTRQYIEWQVPPGELLFTFAHEIAHARQHALVSVDGSAWGIHDWNNTPDGIAYKEARGKDWNEVGKAQLDMGYDRPDFLGNVLTETAAVTCAYYWSVDRWSGRPNYGNLRITTPNRFKWASVWLPKQSGRIQPLSKISGDNQTAIPNTPLPLPFAVAVRNPDDGLPLSGVPVTFAVTAGGGTLSVARTLTDWQGCAQSTLTLGPNLLGTNTVSVSAVGIDGAVTFNAVASGNPIAPAEMATLTRLEASKAGIRDLTGLEHATNLTVLNFDHNLVSDLSPLAGLTNLTGLYLVGNSASDLSPLAGLTNLKDLFLDTNGISNLSPLVGLTQLKRLALNNNSVSDLSPLAGLTGLTWMRLASNKILDLSPLVANTGLGSGDEVDVRGNPLSYTSIKTHIPALQSRGAKIEFDNRTLTSPLKISGDDQQGTPGTALERPFVVEVRDASGSAFEGVPVTFTVTAGGGTLSVASTTTDKNGRAESTLTLGPNPGTNTVTVSVTGIQAEQTFTAEGIRIPKTLEIISGKDQEGLPGEALAKPFVVEVRDRSGEPLLGVKVTFSVSSGGGTLSLTSATTDSSGRAESTLTLGPKLGTNTVSVSVTGIQAEQTFTAEGIRVPLAFWIISGDKQQGLPDEALAKPFVVEVRDQSGEPLPGVQVTFSVSIGGGMLSATSATTNVNGRAETTLTLGPNPGTNTVTVSVTGIQEEQSVTAIAEPPPIPQDVNRDDVVNILDLVLVASDLGDEGLDLAADVNGDGIVNILDLVLVAGAFGDAAAAPSAQAPETLTTADIQTWLTDARSLAGKDAMIKKGIVALEQLLAALTPPETALLLNFPNPFNPETWIPYRLAEDAFVTLTIYDLSGQVIRRLNVGHRIASAYESRSKAIYWDGKNGLGEQVASGVYFYTLTAEDYSATRKMVILQ